MDVPARWWLGELGEGSGEIEDKSVVVEVDSEKPNEIALHTMIDGTVSHCSYYFDRESALSLAVKILEAVRLDG